MNISEEMCDVLNNFIKNNEESDSIGGFAMSCRDMDNAKKEYEEVKNSKESTVYRIFGGCGSTAFSLYKSKEYIIYVIRVSVDTPTNYIKIDINNESVFL
jgi:hypothetical protein